MGQAGIGLRAGELDGRAQRVHYIPGRYFVQWLHGHARHLPFVSVRIPEGARVGGLPRIMKQNR